MCRCILVIFKYSFDLILVNVKNLKIKPGFFYPRIHPAGLLYRVGPGTAKFPIMDHIGLDSEDFTTSGVFMSTGLDRTRTDTIVKTKQFMKNSAPAFGLIEGLPSSLGVIQRMHIKVQIGLYIAYKCICEKLSRFLVLNSECTNLK